MLGTWVVGVSRVHALSWQISFLWLSALRLHRLLRVENHLLTGWPVSNFEENWGQSSHGSFADRHYNLNLFYLYFVAGTSTVQKICSSGLHTSSWRSQTQGPHEITSGWLDDTNHSRKGPPKHVMNSCCLLFSHSVVSNSFVTLWSVARQAPLSMGFYRQEYWSGLPFPPRDLSKPGMEPMTPVTPALAGRFFTTSYCSMDHTSARDFHRSACMVNVGWLTGWSHDRLA